MNVAKLKHSMNCLLPSDIHFISLEEVDETFHARFSCVNKEYRYVINLGEYSPLTNDIMYNYCSSLDIEKIEKRGARLISDNVFSLSNGSIRHNSLKTAYLIFSYLMEGE